jgi:DNA-directed RNA polymerase subunit RPC12/RpoP
MKFVCDRCGKKYATAGDPAPGKVYKLKCKSCGHLIVVRGQAGTMTAIPAITAAELAAATQAQASSSEPGREIELHIEPEPIPVEAIATPLPGATPAWGELPPEPVSDDAIEPMPPAGAEPDPAPLPPEVAMAVDSAAGTTGSEPSAPSPELEDGPVAPVAPFDPALTPPPPEKDELADFAAAAAEAMAAPPLDDQGRPAVPGYVDIFGESGLMKPAGETFAAAARASLPDTWSGATPSMAAPPPPPPPRVPAPPPPTPALARQKAPRSGLGGVPMAIVGVGMVALVAITAYALLSHGGGPPTPVATAPRPEPKPAPPPSPVAEVKPPAPEPVVERKAEPVVERKAEPVPEPREAEKRPEPKAEPRPRPPERKVEKKPEPRVAERKPEPPRPPPAPEPRTETRDVDLPEADAALTQAVVDRVVGANRKAFSGCIANANASDVTLDGRRVALRITVNTNGTVTYPTLDDQSLNTTEMGQCLKSAARLMIFPKFKGDPFHYEVPLILSGN